MRTTKQKSLILSIVNNNHTHPSAVEIYDMCRSIIPAISLGTVYRNLNSLVEEGLIKRIKVLDNIDRYDNVEFRHAHFICIKCGKIIDLDSKYVFHDKIIDNNEVLDCDVNFKGICQECIRKGEK